jgi:hypothetical protein
MFLCKCSPVLIFLYPCILLLYFSDFIAHSIYIAAIKLVISKYTFKNRQLFLFLFFFYWVTIQSVQVFNGRYFVLVGYEDPLDIMQSVVNRSLYGILTFPKGNNCRIYLLFCLQFQRKFEFW